jgi:hypothetical protein
MKHIKLLLISGLFCTGFTIQALAQVKELPEVIVMARNFKYLKSVNEKGGAQPVKLLERFAAAYDVKKSEFYEDDAEGYFISFYLPQGYILAEYDAEGKLIRTAEKFKDVALPGVVRSAVTTRFPNWAITSDVYLVKYNDAAGSKKDYKLILENGDKRMRVKVNEKGEFL